MILPARVREAVAGDLDAIVAVQQACAGAPQWSRTQYAEILQPEPGRSRLRAVFVAEKAGKITGYAVASLAADEAELESVAVLPEARRQGLALAVCGAGLDWATSAGAREMWLEVRSASTGARELYRQLGFVQTSVRKRYYAAPEDDAVLMRANLSQAGHL